MEFDNNTQPLASSSRQRERTIYSDGEGQYRDLSTGLTNIEAYSEDENALPEARTQEDGTFRYGNVIVPQSLHEDYENVRKYVLATPSGRLELARFEHDRRPRTTLQHISIQQPRDIPDPLDPTQTLSNRTRATAYYEYDTNNPTLRKLRDIGIPWDPRVGGATKRGEMLSPSLLLAHEMGHANGFDARANTELPERTNEIRARTEEARVITDIEIPLADVYGEGKRNNHDGTYITVGGVRSTTPLYEDDKTALQTFRDAVEFSGTSTREYQTFSDTINNNKYRRATSQQQAASTSQTGYPPPPPSHQEERDGEPQPDRGFWSCLSSCIPSNTGRTR